MNLSIDAIVQIAAFFTGSSSLIVLVYLLFIASHKGIRLGLMVVILHALNYFIGITFGLIDSVSSGVTNLMVAGQLLTVPLLLFCVMSFLENLGEASFRFFHPLGRGFLILLAVSEIIFYSSSFSLAWLSRIISLLIMFFALFLWVYLYYILPGNDLAGRIRRTGLAGYALIIPWMVLEREFFRPAQIHPANAVSFLFLTIGALIFSIRYLAHYSGASKNNVTPLLAPLEIQQAFGLTDREMEVMGLLTGSCSYKEIASRLGISLATVKTHVSRVYRKTGTAGRSELKFRFPRSK